MARLEQIEGLMEQLGPVLDPLNVTAFPSEKAWGVQVDEDTAVLVDFDEEQEKRAETELGAILAGVDLPAERKTCATRAGGIYHELLEEASEWGADLIVVGSHRPVMSDYLLGSNATTIVRHAQCSVLVVRE